MRASAADGGSGAAHFSHADFSSSAISFRFVEQLASDQHPPYLRSAGPDLVELRVAPQAPGRVVVDVPVAAQRLDRLAGHPRRLLRRIENRTGGVLARGTAGKAAPVESVTHRVDIGAARLHRRIHIA